MAIGVTDNIVGPSRGTPEGWFPYIDSNPNILNRDEVKQWIRDVYKVNANDDMPDAGIVTAQAFVETGNFTNRWWRERKNAGSLGVTGTPSQDEVSPTFATTMESARAMSAHDLLYATGQINRGGLGPVDDPRYSAYREAYGTRSFPKLKDLATRYAADPEYAKTIVARAAQVYSGDLTGEGGGPVAQPIFGRVPHPAFEDIPIKKAENAGQNNLGRRHVYGVVWHRMLGSLRGTSGYFQIPSTRALTDYGVGVGGFDQPHDDGVIIRWNDPLGWQSGWASGSYSSYAYGDGAAFVADYGIDAINRDQASIEISGQANTPLTAKSKQAIVDLTAYWADQNKIPWDVFPVIPGRGYSFVRWHEEFGPDNGTKKCPFDAVKAATPEMIEMVKARLKQYQVQDTSVPPKPPDVPKYAKPGWTPVEDGKDHADAKGTLWRAINRIVRVKGGTKFYAQASLSAKETRAPAPDEGMDVRVAWTFNSWYCTPAGSRFKIAQSDLKVSFRDQEV